MTDMSMNDTAINSNTAIKLDNVLNGTNVYVSAAQDSNTAAQAATAAAEAVVEQATAAKETDLAQDADYMNYATEYERRLNNQKAADTAIANFIEEEENIAARTRTEYADAFKVSMKRTAESTLSMCRVVYEAKKTLSDCDFTDFCSDIGYKDSSPAIRKFTVIGKLYPRLVLALDRLPDSWTSIYEITQIPASIFERMIKDGDSFRHMKGSDLRRVIQYAKPKQTLESYVPPDNTWLKMPVATMFFTKRPDLVDWKAMRKALAEVESRLPVRFNIETELQKAWEAGRDKRYEQAKKAEYGIEIKPDKWDFGREADTLQTVKNDNVADLEEKKAS
jgi:hypothetical protein